MFDGMKGRVRESWLAKLADMDDEQTAINGRRVVGSPLLLAMVIVLHALNHFI